MIFLRKHLSLHRGIISYSAALNSLATIKYSLMLFEMSLWVKPFLRFQVRQQSWKERPRAKEPYYDAGASVEWLLRYLETEQSVTSWFTLVEW